jgi:hypothetical protein
MKKVESKVRYKGKVVEVISIPVFESMDEIMANNPKELVIAMFNRGNTVRLQGITRNKYSTRTGKEKRRAIAFNLLTTDELIRFAGKHEELTAFIDSAEMSARVDNYIEDNNLCDIDSDSNDNEDNS